MKTIRQIILFLLGTAAGVGLFALFVNLRRRTDSPRQVVSSLPAQAVTVPQVQKTPRRSRKHHQAHYPKHGHGMHVDMAEVRMPARPRRHKVSRRIFASSRTMSLAGNWFAPRMRQGAPSPVVAQAALVPHAEPRPTFFKSIGYVEKADGQLEAIIMQDDAVQVVRIGDRIADRYKVTSITPEVVGAIEEPTAMAANVAPSGRVPDAAPETQVSEAKGGDQPSRPTTVAVATEVLAADIPSQAKFNDPPEGEASSVSLGSQVAEKAIGYVEESAGKVDSVVADGDSVRLIPTRRAKFTAQIMPPTITFTALQSAQAASAPDIKSSLTLASPVVHKPAIQPGTPAQETMFRQVVYEDSSPADDEAVPVQPAVSRSRDQNP